MNGNAKHCYYKKRKVLDSIFQIYTQIYKMISKNKELQCPIFTPIVTYSMKGNTKSLNSK